MHTAIHLRLNKTQHVLQSICITSKLKRQLQIPKCYNNCRTKYLLIPKKLSLHKLLMKADFNRFADFQSYILTLSDGKVSIFSKNNVLYLTTSRLEGVIGILKFVK